MNNVKSFMLYSDMGPLVKALPDPARARWASAVFDYVDGKQVDRISENPLENAVWEQTKAKLQFGLDKAVKRSQDARNAANVRYRNDAVASEGMQEHATACDSTEGHATAPTVQNNTSTSTGTVTQTLPSPVLDSDKNITAVDSDSAGPGAGDPSRSVGDARGPRPSGEGDLFTLDQIKRSIAKNKVDLTDQGAEVFLEQMREDHWTMYGKPVDRKAIARVLREWAKKHPEYSKPQKVKASFDNLVNRARQAKEESSGNADIVSWRIDPELYKKLTAPDAELSEFEIMAYCACQGYKNVTALTLLENYDPSQQKQIVKEWDSIIDKVDQYRECFK